MKQLAVVLTAAIAAAPIAAAAQSARAPGAGFALRAAYHALGLAEALGASGPYLDGAREHYRAAVGEAAAQPDRAAGDARVAVDLAHAALAQRAEPIPHDVPAPPAVVAPGESRVLGDAGAVPMHGRGWNPGGPMRPAEPPDRGGHGANAVPLAALVKLAGNDAEVRHLVSEALAHDAAADRAAGAGDVQTAAREERVAGALSQAARDLAHASHAGPRTNR